MKRDELETVEDKLLREIARRRNLGTYNPDAPAILMLAEAVYELTRHLKEQIPEPKKKESKE